MPFFMIGLDVYFTNIVCLVNSSPCERTIIKYEPGDKCIALASKVYEYVSPGPSSNDFEE